MFKKVLIANRGEIALRIIRACRENGLESVAVHSTADTDALHVKFADQAVCIGPPPSKQSYLNVPMIISAAEVTGADAIHPGWGFLAENHFFAEICAGYHVAFIGPSPEAIERLGNKTHARQTMRQAGLPVLPGSTEPVRSLDDARDLALELGYPVMLKAVAGGGGRGIRLLRSEQDLVAAYTVAQAEAESAFNNAAIYLEKCIENARHVEVQIIGDRHGNVVVRARAGGRTDAHRFIRPPHMQRVTVRLRMHRHRANTKLAAGADHTHRHFSPIGHQDLREHSTHHLGRLGQPYRAHPHPITMPPSIWSTWPVM